MWNFKNSYHDQYYLLDSCHTAIGTRRKNFKNTPELEKSDKLNTEAKSRIVFIKDNGQKFLRSFEVFYNVSSPDSKNCEDAVNSWYV